MLKAMIRMSEIATGVQARKTKEHEDFLVFYEALVRGVSPAASKAFGNMSVSLESGSGAGIELTAADFGWWHSQISSGARFADGVAAVKTAMYNRMCKAAESHDMNEAERDEFIDLVKST